MSIAMEQLAKDAMSLPPAERAALAGQLWDSLGVGEPLELSEAWRREIARRRNEIRSGKVKPVPGEEVSRRAWELCHGKGR